jgi:hypothetical protein
MSQDLQDDKEIQENREEIITEKAPLRDQIVKKLFNQLTDDNVGAKIVSMWESANSDRTEWLQRQETYLADYDEFLDVDPQGLFESSSNLHIPMPLWVCRTYHARFLQTLLSPEPSLSVRARKSAFVDVQFDIESFIKYTLTDWCNFNEGIEETLDQWVWAWVTSGIGYTKWRWETKFQKYEDVIQIPTNTTKKVYDPFSKQMVDFPTNEVREEVREVINKTYEGPVCDYVNIEDLVIVGKDMADIDRADAVIERHFLTASDLNTYAGRGIFDQDVVDEIIMGGETMESGAAGGNLKQARGMNSGDAQLDKTYDHKRYEILEAYVSLDVFESGINSEIVIWVDTRSKKIVRATYLNRMNPQGRRPYSCILFHKRSGTNRHYPVGLLEMLHSIGKELDAIHNMRVDFGLISTMPFGFYRASSSIDPKEIKMQPGTLYPTDNPQSDVYFPQLGNRTAFGMQEESQLYVMVERLTGISDLALGSMSGKQGATRTATGVRGLMGEMNTNLDVPLKRLNRGWKRSLQYVLSLLQQRTPKGLEFRITGEEGVSRYAMVQDPSQLSGQYDIEVSPTSAASNKQVQLEVAMQVFQIQQNPLLIQTGIVTPANIYEGLKNLLKVMGIKDISKFVNGQFANQVTLFPKEELDRVLGLEQVDVLPNMDHEGFIGLAQELMADDERMGRISPQQAIALQVQVQKHAQMKNALDMAAAQQANVSQQMTNSNMGQMGQASAPAAPVGGVTEGEF